MNNPKLRSSVSVVRLKNNIVEFFLTNTRKQIRVQIATDDIIDIILKLDGTISIDEIAKNYNMDIDTKEQFIKFIDYLESKSIIKYDDIIDSEEYLKYRRVINFLEDFASSSEDLYNIWENIRGSKVVVIGLGAVGSWVSSLLIQNGVKKIVLIDNDKVDISNLHRQFGYSENDIGKYKVDAMEGRLRAFSNDVEVEKFKMFIDYKNLECLKANEINLIINCADQPSVDVTSLWVGEYCMKNNIPHIIGGGYNLHISLMGQTIIPFKSACVKCFEIGFMEKNNIDTSNLKKMTVKNRKIGSFGPMCSMIASMTAMEGIKVLSGKISPSNLNRRGEFSIYSMDINYQVFDKQSSCEWCGSNGLYLERGENG